MSYLLKMSGEIHDWLAGLQEADAVTARLVGQGLAALMSEGSALGPPLVVPVAATWPDDLAAALDDSYQHRLDRLTIVRRRVAEAAWLVRDLTEQIDELESAQARLADRRRRALADGRPEDAEQAARQLAVAERDATQARQLVPWLAETEAWLRTRSQRMQARTDAFRTRKEVLKAAYIAARAELQADEDLAAAPLPAASPDPPVSPAPPASPAQDATAEVLARLRDATAQIERELGRQPLPDGLLELRPGAPGDSEVRLIFAVEPPGTALLIAVLEGRDTVRDQYRDAVTLSGEVLLEARAGQAPEASAHAYDHPRSLIEEFYPGQAAEIDSGAAALAARNRARTLAEQRTRLGLTQAEVADRMGLPPDEVAAIERAAPGPTDLRTLAAYIEALGGRLELTAEFGPDRIILR